MSLGGIKRLYYTNLTGKTATGYQPLTTTHSTSAPAEFVPVSDSNGKFTEFVWQRLHVTLRYDRYYTQKQGPLGDKDEADADADGRVNIRIR